MKYKAFITTIGIDWDGNSTDGDWNWTYDHEVIIRSNCKKNAKKKLNKWAKIRKGKITWCKFVTDKMWKNDKSYKTKIIK
jgi:hypothetical protein